MPLELRALVTAMTFLVVASTLVFLFSIAVGPAHTPLTHATQLPMPVLP